MSDTMVSWAGKTIDLAGCTAAPLAQYVDNVVYPGGTIVTNDWWPAPYPPQPAPLYPQLFWIQCGCCAAGHHQTTCFQCLAEAMAKATEAMTTTATDALVKQAETRLAELDRKLAEVPALEAERAKLRKMLEAAK